MFRKRLSAVGLCLALTAHPALAGDPYSPAFARCKPAGESRTPMPIWRPKVNGGRLSSEPPAGNARIVYIDLLADDEDVHCANALDSEYYTFNVPARQKAGDLEVNIRGPAGWVGFGAMCSFSGFYVSEMADHDGRRQTNFRPVDKFDVMSSGLFCLGKWTDKAPIPTRPTETVPRPVQSAELALCKRSGEERTPIPSWKPEIGGNDVDPNISSEPPQGDGRIVYIRISLPPGRPCASHTRDMYTFYLPSNPKHRDYGGLEVNLRGNAADKDGRCVLEGFYMNQSGHGVYQGWVPTEFDAVDAQRVASSGTYCLAPESHRDAQK
jgi:hypothetical protein